MSEEREISETAFSCNAVSLATNFSLSLSGKKDPSFFLYHCAVGQFNTFVS